MHDFFILIEFLYFKLLIVFSKKILKEAILQNITYIIAKEKY